MLIFVPNNAVVLLVRLAMISIFDIHDIASRASLTFLPADRTQTDRLGDLRQMLDRFLLVLGVILSGRMVVNAATADSVTTVAEIEDAAAESPAEVPAEFTAGKAIVMSGGVVSALALVDVPAALAVDRLSETMLRSRTKDLDWDDDYEASNALQERYRAELGLDQSVKDRFCPSPLSGALFSVLVLG